MKVAITGSRYGLTDKQKARLIGLLCDEQQITEFHYGACKGVDTEALWLAVECGTGGVFHEHPATLNPRWDAMWRVILDDVDYEQLGIVQHEPKAPLARNRDMVHACDVLWAFPDSDRRSSGTWFTIDYALAEGVPVEVVLP